MRKKMNKMNSSHIIHVQPKGCATPGIPSISQVWEPEDEVGFLLTPWYHPEYQAGDGAG